MLTNYALAGKKPFEFKDKVNKEGCTVVKVPIGKQYFEKWQNSNYDLYSDFTIDVLNDDLADRARVYFDAAEEQKG